jgi:outer membrane protein
MKILNFVPFFVFFITLSMTSAQELKFGHVNSQQLIMELPEYMQAEKAMENEANILQDRRKIMQEEIERKFQEYISQRETLPELIKATMEKDIQDLQQRLENYDMLAQQSLSKKQQDLLQPILDKVSKAIENVGEENGFFYIFDISTQIVLYHSDVSIDCTQMIKAKLGVK